MLKHNTNLTNKPNNTQSTDTMIVLQDFTQQEPQSGFNQDFILTFLTFDANAPDKLRRQYLHYVGEQDDKNDVYFVITVWEHLMRDGVIGDEIKHIEVWSDGGPKHFKMKECMYYFSTIKQKYNKTITYNFYQSYHGHNSCDAAASHSKKAIINKQRNTNILIYTAQDITNAINTLNNHTAQVVPTITKPPINASSMPGIKSYYKYTFPQPTIIHAFTTSADTVPAKIYTVTGNL